MIKSILGSVAIDEESAARVTKNVVDEAGKMLTAQQEQLAANFEQSTINAATKIFMDLKPQLASIVETVKADISSSLDGGIKPLRLVVKFGITYCVYEIGKFLIKKYADESVVLSNALLGTAILTGVTLLVSDLPPILGLDRNHIKDYGLKVIKFMLRRKDSFIQLFGKHLEKRSRAEHSGPNEGGEDFNSVMSNANFDDEEFASDEEFIDAPSSDEDDDASCTSILTEDDDAIEAHSASIGQAEVFTSLASLIAGFCLPSLAPKKGDPDDKGSLFSTIVKSMSMAMSAKKACDFGLGLFMTMARETITIICNWTGKSPIPLLGFLGVPRDLLDLYDEASKLYKEMHDSKVGVSKTARKKFQDLVNKHDRLLFDRSFNDKVRAHKTIYDQFTYLLRQMLNHVHQYPISASNRDKPTAVYLQGQAGTGKTWTGEALSYTMALNKKLEDEFGTETWPRLYAEENERRRNVGMEPMNARDRHVYRKKVFDAIVADFNNNTADHIFSMNYSNSRLDSYTGQPVTVINDVLSAKDHQTSEHVHRLIHMIDKAPWSPEFPDLIRKGSFFTCSLFVLSTNLRSIKDSVQSLTEPQALARRLNDLSFIVTPKPEFRADEPVDPHASDLWKWKLKEGIKEDNPCLYILSDPYTGEPVMKEAVVQARNRLAAGATAGDDSRIAGHAERFSLSSDGYEDTPYKLVFDNIADLANHVNRYIKDNQRKTTMLNEKRTEEVKSIIEKNFWEAQRSMGAFDGDEEYFNCHRDAIIAESGSIPPPKTDVFISTVNIKDMDEGIVNNALNALSESDIYLRMLSSKWKQDIESGETKEGDKKDVYVRIIDRHFDSMMDRKVDLGQRLLFRSSLMQSILCDCWFLDKHETRRISGLLTPMCRATIELYPSGANHRAFKNISHAVQRALHKSKAILAETAQSMKDAFGKFILTVRSFWSDSPTRATLLTAGAVIGVMLAGLGLHRFANRLESQSYNLNTSTRWKTKRTNHKLAAKNAKTKARKMKALEAKEDKVRDIVAESGVVGESKVGKPAAIPHNWNYKKFLNNMVFFYHRADDNKKLAGAIGLKDNLVLLPTHFVRSDYPSSTIIEVVVRKGAVFNMTFSAIKDRLVDQSILYSNNFEGDYCLWKSPSAAKFKDITKCFLPRNALTAVVSQRRSRVTSISACDFVDATGKRSVIGIFRERPIIDCGRNPITYASDDGSIFKVNTFVTTEGDTTKGDSGNPILVSTGAGNMVIGIHSAAFKHKAKSIECTISLEDIQRLMALELEPECYPSCDLSSTSVKLVPASDLAVHEELRILDLQELKAAAVDGVDYALVDAELEYLRAYVEEREPIPRVLPSLGEPVAMVPKSNSLTAITSYSRNNEMWGAIHGEQPEMVVANMTFAAGLEKVKKGSATLEHPKRILSDHVLHQVNYYMMSELSKVVDPCKTLSTYTAICGKDQDSGEAVLQSLPRKTSAGFRQSFLGHKDKVFFMGRDGDVDRDSRGYKEFENSIREIENLICSGVEVITVLKPSCKDEMLPKRKEGSTRIIYCSEVEFSVICRKQYGDWISQMVDPCNLFRNHSALGMNVATDGESFLNSLVGNAPCVELDPSFFSVDVKTYDAGQSSQIISANFEVADASYHDLSDRDKMIRAWIRRQSSMPHIWVADWIYRREGGWSSGHVLTTLFNNLTWRRAMLLAVAYAGQTSDGDRLVGLDPRTGHHLLNLEGAAKLFNNISFGDDNVIYWPNAVIGGKPVNTGTLSAAIRDVVGWTVTNSDKSDPILYPQSALNWHEIEFLKRRFVFHTMREYGPGVPRFYMPIDLDSVRKSLNYKNSNTTDKTLEQVVDNALVQIAYHGKVAWDEYAPGLIRRSHEVLGYFSPVSKFELALVKEIPLVPPYEEEL